MCEKAAPGAGVLPLLHDTLFIVLINVFSEAVIEVSEHAGSSCLQLDMMKHEHNSQPVRQATPVFVNK